MPCSRPGPIPDPNLTVLDSTSVSSGVADVATDACGAVDTAGTITTMAHGTELMVAITRNTARDLYTRHAVSWIEPDPNDDTLEELHTNLGDIEAALQPALTGTHLQLVHTLWDPTANLTADGNYINTNTPAGPRTLSVLRFTIAYDPHELGDRWPEDIAVGVAVSGRYFPVLADYRNPHGTLGTTIALTGDTLELAEHARTALADTITEFNDAHLAVRTHWY